MWKYMVQKSKKKKIGFIMIKKTYRYKVHIFYRKSS